MKEKQRKKEEKLREQELQATGNTNHCPLTKTTLFYFYFMAILMLSHLFFSYFILANLYFIPSLPDEENRASILFVFYIYFKPIFKEDRTKWGILSVFSHKILQNRLFYPYFSLGGKGNDLLLCKIDIK